MIAVKAWLEKKVICRDGSWPFRFIGIVTVKFLKI